MSSVIPRHVICVLGTWGNLDEVDAVVRAEGGQGFTLDRDYSQLEPDPRMRTAFESSYDRVRPTMTPEDWRAVQEHRAVAYVLSPPLRKAEALALSGKTLQLTAALLHNGGVAAKGESAGIAHGRDHWLGLSREYATAGERSDRHGQAAVLFRAWVRRPLLGDGTYYSCGMHLLGERDVEIDSATKLSSALEWIDLLGLYLVADQPSREVSDGDGFRLRDAGPRRVMRFRPNVRYEPDDFFFNPYGYVRLAPDDSTADAARK